jgi:membrane fusion protein, multidrug efflux system
MYRVTKYAIGLVVMLVAAGIGVDRYLSTSTSALASSQPPPPPPVPAVVAQVHQGDVPIVLDGLGTVQALNTAVIRSQVTGLLQTVNFNEGQTVKRGDLLGQIDPRPEQAMLDEAVAQLGRDQANLANTQINLGRNVPLLHQGFATDQLVTDEKAQIAELQATIKFDQAAIENARTQLSYTSLVAPFDGVTGVRMMDMGNVIHPTDTNGLVTVTQVQPIDIVFILPTSDIPAVQQALEAGPVVATAYDQAGTKKLDVGKLLLINNLADPSTGTVQLKAEFPNPKRLLWPGAFVNVELAVRVVHDGLTIPTDALQQGANGPLVYVVGPGEKVAARTVQVTQRHRGVALVSEGLKPDETVVTQGQYRLADGIAITPSPPEQVANESAASAGLLP